MVEYTISYMCGYIQYNHNSLAWRWKDGDMRRSDETDGCGFMAEQSNNCGVAAGLRMAHSRDCQPPPE